MWLWLSPSQKCLLDLVKQAEALAFGSTTTGILCLTSLHMFLMLLDNLLAGGWLSFTVRCMVVGRVNFAHELYHGIRIKVLLFIGFLFKLDCTLLRTCQVYYCAIRSILLIRFVQTRAVLHCHCCFSPSMNAAVIACAPCNTCIICVHWQLKEHFMWCYCNKLAAIVAASQLLYSQWTEYFQSWKVVLCRPEDSRLIRPLTV